MNGARQTWLVAAREIRERGRSRAFLTSLLLVLVAVAGVIVLPGLLDAGSGAKDVGFTGQAPTGLTDALRAQGDAVDTTIRIRTYGTVADGEAAVRDGDIDVLVIDAQQLEWRKQVDEQLQAIVTGAIQLVAVRDRAEAAGIDPDELLAIVEPVPVTNIELSQVAGRSPDDETAAFLMTMVLFFAISTYGAMVLSGVVEEKSSRTVEVLLARIPARNLLGGKIAGIGLLGGPGRGDRHRRAHRRRAHRLLRRPRGARQRDRLGRRLVHSRLFPLRHAVRHPRISGLPHRRRVERHRPRHHRPRPRIHGLVRRNRQRGHHLGAVGLMVPVHRTARHAESDRYGRRVLVGSRTCPASSPSRPSADSSSSAGVSTHGRSSTPGQRSLSLSQAWRGASAPPHAEIAAVEAPEGREVPDAMQASATREARMQFILTVIGIAVGGVVFALTSDFIVGVGVGAAVFALARQAIKLWSNNKENGQLQTVEKRDREPAHR